MSNNTNVEPEPSSWLTIIPDFFYEVIGRIIPGGTFILGLTYTINQTFLFDLIFKKKIAGEPVDPSYALIFILLLGFSYSLGYFLTPFGECLGKYTYFKRQYIKKFSECSDEHCEWLRKKTNLKTKGVEDNFELIFQSQHDQVRNICPKLIRSLAKSQADVQLCINTSAAFFILVIVSAIIGIIPPANNVCFLLAIGFLFAACYRNKRFLERQFSFSKIAQDEEARKRDSQN